MKKLIVVFAAIAITAGAYAQADSTGKKMSHPEKKQSDYGTNQNQDNTSVKNQNRDMNSTKQNHDMNSTTPNHDMNSTNQNSDMNTGTKLNKDNSNTGTNQTRDNSSTGTNQTRDNSAQYQNTQNDKSQSDGVVMQNGKVMKVSNGQMTSLKEKELTMSNGTKIMSDGTCIKKDGSKTMMKEGQHMDMSGNMSTAKTNKDENMYLVPDSARKIR